MGFKNLSMRGIELSASDYGQVREFCEKAMKFQTAQSA
jgi:hypothetical protein